MRAVIFRRFGGADVLEMTEVERPRPLPNDVLVRVCAVGTNPVDLFVRSGVGRGVFTTMTPPCIPGWDIAGVVEEVMAGVTRFQVGDAVFGMPFFPRAASAYAEYVLAPSRQLARKPAAIDHVHAAALPLAGLTAWQALVDAAGVRPGQRVLIIGAGGGVGHFAVQIAKALGAHVVAIASTGKIDFVRSLGADEVIDYRTTDFAKVIQGIDVALDLVGGSGDRTLEGLRAGGILVTAVERTNTELAARVHAAGRRFAGITVEPDHVGLEGLAALVEQCKLRVHVSHVLPLAEAARAHALLESGGVTGKVVLTL